jgi:hypothetical protein
MLPNSAETINTQFGSLLRLFHKWAHKIFSADLRTDEHSKRSAKLLMSNRLYCSIDLASAISRHPMYVNVLAGENEAKVG